MKNNITQSVLTLFSIVLCYSCSPYGENPAEESLEAGANIANEVSHQVPDPKCGYDMMVPLVFNAGGQEITIGQCELVNGTEYMHIIFYPQSGLSVAVTAAWRGKHSVFCGTSTGGDCVPPTDAEGNTDPLAFPYVSALKIPLASAAIVIPLREIYEANSFAAYAQLVAVDQSGLPIFSTSVWAKGKSLQNGSQLIDYILTSCPDQGCEPWMDGAPNCYAPYVPPCEVPVVAPGDNHDAFSCRKGSGEVKFTVCHLPPGNPDNMQEICISETALPAHIIDFKPADNPCMGHHSGCHIGPCDPCGAGSSVDNALRSAAFAEENSCPGN